MFRPRSGAVANIGGARKRPGRSLHCSAREAGLLQTSEGRASVPAEVCIVPPAKRGRCKHRRGAQAFRPKFALFRPRSGAVANIGGARKRPGSFTACPEGRVFRPWACFGLRGMSGTGTLIASIGRNPTARYQIHHWKPSTLNRIGWSMIDMSFWARRFMPSNPACARASSGEHEVTCFFVDRHGAAWPCPGWSND